MYTWNPGSYLIHENFAFKAESGIGKSDPYSLFPQTLLHVTHLKYSFISAEKLIFYFFFPLPTHKKSLGSAGGKVRIFIFL